MKSLLRFILKVTVFLHSKLVKTSSKLERRLEVLVDEDTDVEGLIAQLDLSVEAKLLLIGLNGEPAGLDEILQDGDNLHLILPISGG